MLHSKQIAVACCSLIAAGLTAACASRAVSSGNPTRNFHCDGALSLVVHNNTGTEIEVAPISSNRIWGAPLASVRPGLHTLPIVDDERTSYAAHLVGSTEVLAWEGSRRGKDNVMLERRCLED